MKLVSENINDYLPAPSEEEIEKRLENSGLKPGMLLIKSAKSGYLKGVKKAVEQGVDIYTNEEALHLASFNGHLNIVKYLVEQGADIHASNDLALQWAAREGHLDIVKYLVNKGADIHAKGNRALRRASQEGHKDVVNYFKSQIKEENNE